MAAFQNEGHRPPTAKDANKHVPNSIVVLIEEQEGKALGQYRTTEMNLIYHLKKQIERDKCIPFTHQILLLGDLELQNGRKLKHYKIESGVKLTLRQEKSEPKEPSYERGEATIFIRTLTGKTISIPEISIERLIVGTMKQIIAAKVGMEPGEMRLIFGGKQIEDGRTLGKDYGVGNGSTLHLVQRLEGGVEMASK